jgi:hypothetical protein
MSCKPPFLQSHDFRAHATRLVFLILTVWRHCARHWATLKGEPIASSPLMKVPEDPDSSTNHHTDTAAITDTDTFIFFPIVIIVHISTRRDNSYIEHKHYYTKLYKRKWLKRKVIIHGAKNVEIETCNSLYFPRILWPRILAENITSERWDNLIGIQIYVNAVNVWKYTYFKSLILNSKLRRSHNKISTAVQRSWAADTGNIQMTKHEKRKLVLCMRLHYTVSRRNYISHFTRIQWKYIFFLCILNTRNTSKLLHDTNS